MAHGLLMDAARTFALTLAYDGSRFAGWQVQPNQRTVQGELERVLSIVSMGSSSATGSRILGSGRTDSGVHAIGQVARCRIEWTADESALRSAFNAKLPADIVIRDVRETHSRFHPIADAISKQYRYRVQVGGPRDVFAHHWYTRVLYKLDLDAMQACAEVIRGEHDFAAFQAAGAERDSTTRTVWKSQWIVADRISPMMEAPTPENLLADESVAWTYVVAGNGFLYNMVRNLVGSMLEVGRGRQSVKWMRSLLTCRDRRQAGPTAPAAGLTLWSVDYPRGIFVNRASHSQVSPDGQRAS
ncbi:MAG: tRNA pseudouridine(38-40) synthase TruA [Planctomycetota bacterium]